MQPLEKTIAALAKSRNEAATPTLVAALDSDRREIFDGAVRAIVSRRSKVGHLAVLKLWPTLDAHERKWVDESQGRMGGALRDALLSDDDRLFASACEVAHESGEFDLAPTLIVLAEKPDGPRSQQAMRLVLEMVERLGALETAGEDAGYSRHPETIRRCVLESLERSVERFAEHRREKLIEAFVVLAGAESLALRLILESIHHPCHQIVVDTLTHSDHPGVLDLLTSYLIGQDAPQIVRTVVGRRTDRPFVEALCAIPLNASNGLLLKNLSRIKAIACLDVHQVATKKFADQHQASAMWIVGHSGATEEAKLELAAALLARGSQPGRLAACNALTAIVGQRSNELVLSALADDDAEVQAAATRQLRDRHIPGTMARLIELVDSPHEIVRAAAREALTEFSIENYLLRYETLDDESRRATGSLVARVDQQTLPRLKGELASPIRRHRLRAIEIAEVMGVIPLIADALVERLSDEDHMVRAAVAEALQHCTAFDVRDALLAAIDDRSFAVQSAARASLRQLGVEIG